jgi:hypothetical protein
MSEEHECCIDNQGLCHICGVLLDEELWIRYSGKPKTVPRYEHDCGSDRCKFLGQHGKHDLYACVRNKVADTVIARYGSDGPEYASGLLFAQRGLISELVEAMRRAEAMDIDCSKGV